MGSEKPFFSNCVNEKFLVASDEIIIIKLSLARKAKAHIREPCHVVLLFQNYPSLKSEDWKHCWDGEFTGSFRKIF